MKFKLLIASFLSSLLILNMSLAEAGIKSKIALLVGTKILVSAIKNPKLQSTVVNNIIKNPALKQKAVDNLSKIVANPKYANLKNESQQFLSKVQNINVPKTIVTKPPATGPPSLIPTIGGRAPINSKYAGQVHPSGIKFTPQGFPDFSKVSIKQVDIQLTGVRAKDFALANKQAGFSKTPKGYTWHHHENGKTMQLVPRKIHDEVKHTGGQAVFNNGGKFD
jgi:hypothetical protein